MRRLTKAECPAILHEEHDKWLAAYQADKTNNTNKYRYRHRQIKDALKTETGWKCVYCESRIGHNTPGDVEHKTPSSKDDTKHFQWENLTVACTECNRRKSDYYDEANAFLDPYNEDVEDMLQHKGPLVLWVLGNTRAEITVRTLELHNGNRNALINRKIETINSFVTLVERWNSEPNGVLQHLLWKEIETCISKDAEYSGMLKAILEEII